MRFAALSVLNELTFTKQAISTPLFGVLNCNISEPMAATLTPPFINLEVSEKFLVDSVSAFPHNGDKITFVFVLNKIHYSFPKV